MTHSLALRHRAAGAAAIAFAVLWNLSGAAAQAEPLQVGAADAAAQPTTPAADATTPTTPGETPDVPGPTDTTEDAAEKYPEVKAALEKFQAGDVEGALEQLKTAKAAHADLSQPQVLLAMMLAQANQAPAARNAIEKAILDDPTDPEPLLIFADQAIRDRRVTEADLLYEKVAGLLPNYKGNEERAKNYKIRLNAGRAAAAQYREQYDQAKTFLDQWLAVDSEAAAAHYRLGDVLFQLGKEKEGYAELQKANELDSNVQSPEITMGLLYDRKKDNENAAKWMEYAVTRVPNDVKQRLQVARWYWLKANNAKAKEHIDGALAVDANSVEALVLSGLLARHERDFDTAEATLNKAMQLDPKSFDAANQLALVLIERDDLSKRQQALQLARGSLQANQNNPTNGPAAAGTLAWVLYRMGQRDQAAKFFDVAWKNGYRNSEAIYLLAKLQGDQGNFDAVRQLLAGALKSELPFAYREEAQKWNDQLAKQNP